MIRHTLLTLPLYSCLGLHRMAKSGTATLISICIFAVAFSCALATPVPATQWKAKCAQTTFGNISGIRPGTQYFTKYYDYPLRDRYSFENGNQQVYRFDVVDPRTKFGKAFGWNINDPSKCCFIWLESLAPGQPPPGTPKHMVPIQVANGSTDLGPEGAGEHFHHNQNLIVFKQSEDWLIDLKHSNAVLEWNKTVTLANQYVSLSSVYLQ